MHKFLRADILFREKKKFPLWIILFTLQLSSATPCLSAHYYDWKWVCQERYNLKNENTNTEGILITQQIHTLFFFKWEINLFLLTFFQKKHFSKLSWKKSQNNFYMNVKLWKLFSLAIHGLPHKHKGIIRIIFQKEAQRFLVLTRPNPEAWVKYIFRRISKPYPKF